MNHSPKWGSSEIEEFETCLGILIDDLQKLKNYVSERDVVDIIDKQYMGQSKQWIKDNFNQLMAAFSGLLAWRSSGAVLDGREDGDHPELVQRVNNRVAKVIQSEYERKVG